MHFFPGKQIQEPLSSNHTGALPSSYLTIPTILSLVGSPVVEFVRQFSVTLNKIVHQLKLEQWDWPQKKNHCKNAKST